MVFLGDVLSTLFAAGATEDIRIYVRDLIRDIGNRGLIMCQGRNEREPLERRKREPVRRTIKQGFSGEKRLWSVAEEAFLPRSAFGAGGFIGLQVGDVCGGFA